MYTWYSPPLLRCSSFHITSILDCYHKNNSQSIAKSAISVTRNGRLLLLLLLLLPCFTSRQQSNGNNRITSLQERHKILRARGAQLRHVLTAPDRRRRLAASRSVIYRQHKRWHGHAVCCQAYSVNWREVCHTSATVGGGFVSSSM